MNEVADIIFLVGGFVFAVLLVPTLRDTEAAVPRMSSIPTMVLLVIYAGTFASIEMYLAAIANTATAFAWLLIAVYRVEK